MMMLDGRAGDHDDAARRDDAQVHATFARVEARLVAEFGGNPAADALVRAHVVAVQEYFAGARVRRYLPILVERAVRGRLAVS